MKTFNAPVVEVLKFTVADVITTSNPTEATNNELEEDRG